MADLKTCTLDYFPENILIDILSYLNVRELVRSGRVCKRWRRLVRDQRLWRAVDLTTWRGVTSRLLWVLLRQYLGCGLRCLWLRGLLLSARGGSFLSESWLQALASRCPRLRRLSLLHTDLRGMRSCSLLPPTLQVLELHGCELPTGFFTVELRALPQAPTAPGKTDSAPASSSTNLAIETLVLDNVPSFTDQHLQSLCSWPQLRRLELRDVIRVTAAGVRGCAPLHEPGGTPGLCRLRSLEMTNTGRPGAQLQMASLGLGGGWEGLEELGLGGREVGPGMLCLSRLRELRRLCLHHCLLTETMVLRSCRMLRDLHRLEFRQVDFQSRHRTPEAEREEGGESGVEGEEKEHGEPVEPDERDPLPSLRRSLASLLPHCELVFTYCTVTVCRD